MEENVCFHHNIAARHQLEFVEIMHLQSVCLSDRFNSFEKETISLIFLLRVEPRVGYKTTADCVELSSILRTPNEIVRIKSSLYNRAGSTRGKPKSVMVLLTKCNYIYYY